MGTAEERPLGDGCLWVLVVLVVVAFGCKPFGRMRLTVREMRPQDNFPLTSTRARSQLTSKSATSIVAHKVCLAGCSGALRGKTRIADRLQEAAIESLNC